MPKNENEIIEVEEVDVDQYRFYNLIHSEKAIAIRGTELLEFAKQLMPKEPKITE